jgi:hypothetical protein
MPLRQSASSKPFGYPWLWVGASFSISAFALNQMIG